MVWKEQDTAAVRCGVGDAPEVERARHLVSFVRSYSGSMQVYAYRLDVRVWCVYTSHESALS